MYHRHFCFGHSATYKKLIIILKTTNSSGMNNKRKRRGSAHSSWSCSTFFFFSIMISKSTWQKRTSSYYLSRKLTEYVKTIWSIDQWHRALSFQSYRRRRTHKSFKLCVRCNFVCRSSASALFARFHFYSFSPATLCLCCAPNRLEALWIHENLKAKELKRKKRARAFV